MIAAHEDREDRTPDSAITSIKTSVAESLRSADSDVRIRTTDYFNNTYVPDMVLVWPRQGIERHVYLRTSANVDYLIEDVGLAEDPSSIFMPLARINLEEGDAEAQRQELQAASRTRKSLVTQPESFAGLGEARADRPVIDLASRSLLQGGSGYVPPDRAVEFGNSLSSGFEGAKLPGSGVGAAVGDAVQAAEDLLDPAHAAEVSSFLHAVWVGSGGDGSQFPGGEGVTAAPTGAALDILLRTVEISDPAFWARMARSLTFAKLSEITATANDQNFQHLMRAAVDVLKAKGVRLVDGVPGGGEASWFLDQGELALRYKEITAVFAAGRIRDLSRSGVRATATISELQRRAQRSGIELTEISVGTSDRHFDYGSEDGGTITQDQQLGEFATALGGEAEVRKAVARVGERDLIIDFATSTAHGRTAGTLYLSEFVKHIPLFADFSREDIGTLIRTSTSHESGSDTDPEEIQG